ncbi:YggT family protein [Jannaschia sp. R86511]|uniref:YggT family protein n=1 Tax=Jannaschia sp. R86511 TaxID=3093853 RepID=UPI0036D41FED
MAVLVVLGFVLLLVEVVLIARVVVDVSVLLAGPAVHGSLRARAGGAVVALTEPVLAPVRRVVPPVRVGPVSLDLAFTVVFVAVLLARGLLLAVAGV